MIDNVFASDEYLKSALWQSNLIRNVKLTRFVVNRQNGKQCENFGIGFCYNTRH